MPSNKQIAMAAGGLIAAGAIVYIATKKSATAEGEDDVGFTASPTTAAAPKAAEAPKAAPAAAPAKAEATPAAAPAPVAAKKAEEPVAAAKPAAKVEAAPAVEKKEEPVAVVEAAKPAEPEASMVQMDDGTVKYPNLGVEMKLVEGGWMAVDEASPMPNVAMITMQKPEYADRTPQAPGEIPVVLLSIEDISLEGLNIDEFREKSKAMAVYQMSAMTQGMFQPSIDRDGTLAVGPFTHCLEYSQLTPFFQMKVMNLISVVDGFAYIFQIMSSPADFDKTKREVFDIAKTMKLSERVTDASAETPFLSVKTKTASVHAAASWKLAESSNEKNPIFVFETASSTKTETISVYDNTLDNMVDLAVFNAAEKTVLANGAEAATYKDGGNRQITVIKNATATVVLRPTMKFETVTPTAAVVSILDSLVIGANDGVNKAELRYVNNNMGFAFDTRADAKIMESRLGERTVVYAPFGIPTDPNNAEEGPIMTVRSGNPSNDPDCRSSIEEWYQHIKATAEQENILEVKKDNVGGRQCVTFVNREMQETGPGQKEERTAKVVIFLEGITTTMIRWEAPSGIWRKHERFINAVNESFILQ